MATVYFTTNADSGSGSLRAAISSAEAGDVIMPDPEVFTSGPVEIALSSTLITQVDITIDGGEGGIILNGQNSNISAVSIAAAGETTLINCVIKRFKRLTAAPVYLNHASAVLNLYRCIIADNSNRYYGSVYALRGELNLYDSLITGNDLTTNNSSYAAVYIASGGSVTATRTTVSGNVNANIYGTSRFTNVNTFVGLTPPTIDGTTPEEIGFVTPPPSATIPYGEHTEGDWQSWDFRLKPTSPYLTGAAYQSGDKDLLGHARTGSWGCYDGSWLVVGANGSETFSADTTVDWLEVASTGVLTLSGADRILTVSRGVFVESGAAITSASRGYVVAPSASDCAAATLTNVVCCVSGAGASNFAATTAGFTWSSADSTKSVVLEKQLFNGAWTTVAQTSGTSYSATLSAGDSVRLFDGMNFLTATVPAGPEPPGERTPFWTILRWAVAKTNGGEDDSAWSVTNWAIANSNGGTSADPFAVSNWITVEGGGSDAWNITNWAIDPELIQEQ